MAKGLKNGMDIKDMPVYFKWEGKPETYTKEEFLPLYIARQKEKEKEWELEERRESNVATNVRGSHGASNSRRVSGGNAIHDA